MGFAAGSGVLHLFCWGKCCSMHFSTGTVWLGIFPAVPVASWVPLLVESPPSGDPGDPCSWAQCLEQAACSCVGVTWRPSLS